jgi:hypothetical protein
MSGWKTRSAVLGARPAGARVSPTVRAARLLAPVHRTWVRQMRPQTLARVVESKGPLSVQTATSHGSCFPPRRLAHARPPTTRRSAVAPLESVGLKRTSQTRGCRRARPSRALLGVKPYHTPVLQDANRAPRWPVNPRQEPLRRRAHFATSVRIQRICRANRRKRLRSDRSMWSAG